MSWHIKYSLLKSGLFIQVRFLQNEDIQKNGFQRLNDFSNFDFDHGNWGWAGRGATSQSWETKNITLHSRLYDGVDIRFVKSELLNFILHANKFENLNLQL